MDKHVFPPTGFAVAWLGCTLQYKLSYPLAKDAPYEVLIGLVVSEEKIFEIVNGGWRTDEDGRRTSDHGYTISSPMSLRLW